MLFILNCKIMFSGINSNDKAYLQSPTNQGYRYAPSYFISRDKTNSTNKNVVNREYSNSYSKTNYKNISTNYDYPTWKQNITSSPQNRPQSYSKENQTTFHSDPDSVILRKENTQLKERIVFLQSQLISKNQAPNTFDKQIHYFKLAQNKDSRKIYSNNSTYQNSESPLEKNGPKIEEVMQLQKQITELQKNSQRLVKYNSQLKQENDKLKLKDLMEKDELLKRKEMKIEHFHAQIQKLKKNNLNMSEYGSISLQRANSLKSQNDDLKQQIELNKKKVKDLQEQANKNYKSTSTHFNSINQNSIVSPLNLEYGNEIEKLTVQIKKKSEMIKYLEYQCSKNGKKEKEELDNLKQELLELKKDYSELYNQKEEYKEKLKQFIYDNTHYKTQFEEMKNKLKDIDDEGNSSKERWEKEKSLLTQKLNQALLYNEKYVKEEKTNIHNKLKQYKQEIKEYEEKQNYLMSLSQKYNALAKQLDNVIEDKSELEQKLQAKAKEIQMLNMKHEEQQKTINVFKHSEVQRVEIIKEEKEQAIVQYQEQIQKHLRLVEEKEQQSNALKEQTLKYRQQVQMGHNKLNKMALDMHELNEFLLQLQKQNISKDEKIGKLQTQIKEIGKQGTEKEQYYKQLKEKYNLIMHQIQQLKQQLKQLVHNHQQKVQEFKELQQQHHTLLSQTTQERENVYKEYALLKQRSSGLQGQVQVYKSKVFILEEEIKHQYDSYDELQNNHKQTQANHQELSAKYTHNTKLNAQLQQLNQQYKGKIQLDQTQIEQLRMQVNRYQRENEELEQKISEMKDRIQGILKDEDNGSGQGQLSNKPSSVLKTLQSNTQQEQIIQFVEVDKNALLYITDLLQIQGVQGQLIRNIIEKLQEISKELPYIHSYIQILQLFNISSQMNNAQQLLIKELTSLVSKIKLIQNDNKMLKRNMQMHKEGEIVNSRLVHRLQYLVQEQNSAIMKEKLRRMCYQYQQNQQYK